MAPSFNTEIWILSEMNGSGLSNYGWTAINHQQPSTFPSSARTEVIPDREYFDKTRNDEAVDAKLPIPRNPRPKIVSSSGRVSKACENCHEQKAKCSGHRPACNRCQDSGAHCYYGDRKGIAMVKWVLLYTIAAPRTFFNP